MEQKVVQPMEPKWLIKYFSKSMLDDITLTCINAAFNRYHKAISDAGEMLEKDLLNCKDLPIGGQEFQT